MRFPTPRLKFKRNEILPCVAAVPVSKIEIELIPAQVVQILNPNQTVVDGSFSKQLCRLWLMHC